MIIVTVLRTHAAATVTEVLTAGRVGMEAKFHFSSEWDGLGKTAVFEAGGETRDVIVDPDGILVPHECMIAGADLRVGVYGYDESGEIVIPTIYALVGQVQRGADPSGDESYPPTPAVGEQAVAVASKALQAAAEAREVAADIQRRADAGEFDGAPGYTPVKGEDYFDGNDYVLTEADKVEIAEIAADLVDVPESGGSADLTGYATEEWVEKGYQPKGDYATKDEIPPVPTKLSAFTNDAGFVTEDALENVGGKAYVQDTEPAQMEVGEFWYNPDEEGGSIPTTLPNPHKLTFSGAVNAEYDGSEAVEVVIPQGGGGAASDPPMLVDLTTTEPCKDIVIDADNSGNPLCCENRFYFEAVLVPGVTDEKTLYVTSNGNTQSDGPIAPKNITRWKAETVRITGTFEKIMDNRYRVIVTNQEYSSGSWVTPAASSDNVYDRVAISSFANHPRGNAIIGFRIGSLTDGGVGAGSTLKIWGD